MHTTGVPPDPAPKNQEEDIRDTILDLRPYQGLDDFTRYVPRFGGSDRANLSAIESLLKSGQEGRSRRGFSLNETIQLRSFGDFRAMICSCFAGERYSLTFRKGEGAVSSQDAEENHPPADAFRTGSQCAPSGYAIPDKPPKRPYLFSMHTYVQALFQAIFGVEPKTGDGFAKKTGMVLVAGSTASGKSNIARGLIYEYLTSLIKTKKKSEDRRPHLVTFEDPIEVRYYKNPETSTECGLDYTPRQKGADVANLHSMLRDCLRQTPDAVYVGETRDLSDWKELVEFAGTGHLVFTTCHAGSLTEVINSLLKAVNAGTAAGRNLLASRLLAAVHLRPALAHAGEETREAILPGLWLRTPAGINALTSDGLAAILPRFFHSAPPGAGDKTRYCFGRTYFAEVLKHEKAANDKDSFHDSLAGQAIQFDLEGL